MANLKMLVSQMSIVCCLLALISAEKVPVLMWSQSRPLSDLPQAFAGNSVDGETFLQKYLSPVTRKAGQNVVAFIQDKLDMEDFTKYADVYNPFSDGGAFKNIKGFMDDQFSVNIPAVHSPKTVIDSLMKTFRERVLKVSSPQHVSALKMKKDKNYLILVLLPATSQDKNEERAMMKNDEKVGEIVKALNKHSIDFTAIFTGESSKRTTQSAHKGRHLLATADNVNVTGIFANVSGNMYFYSRNIQVTVVNLVTKDKAEVKEYTAIDFPTGDGSYYFNASEWTNKTAFFQLETQRATSNISGTDYSLMFKLTAERRADRWFAANFSLSVTNRTGTEQSIIEDQAISLKNADIQLPPHFSYHCSNITLYPFNMSKENKVYAVIRFDGLQFQPFGIENGQFSEAWDCVGFFTTPIWMGLFPVGIFTVILFFGMYMITQLSTMDRFDDPKGKTITVNVNE